jgi:uncharacterized coiled-coil protein SlyX
MDLFDNKKKEDDVKHVLEVLSLNIESINQRLSKNDDNAIPEEIVDNINSILSMQKYLYSSVHKISSDLQNINSNLAMQNKKIDDLRMVVSGVAKNEAIHKRMDELVERFGVVLKLLKEETRVIRDQNQIIQRFSR